MKEKKNVLIEISHIFFIHEAKKKSSIFSFINFFLLATTAAAGADSHR